MDQQKINHFHTLGFVVYKQLLTPIETENMSLAFDAAMRKARNDEAEPELTQDERGYSKIRQQVNCHIPPHVPFFDLDPDSFYPYLTDERFDDVFRTLLGDDYYVSASEGIIHAGGSAWHHDGVGAEGYFSMRAHIYLDVLGPEDGCLSVIPGSHFTAYRETLTAEDADSGAKGISRLGVAPEQVPGRYDLVNEPGDVVFLNHKTHHSSLSGRARRRCVHINARKAANTEDRDDLVDALRNYENSPHAEIRMTAAVAMGRVTSSPR